MLVSLLHLGRFAEAAEQEAVLGSLRSGNIVDELPAALAYSARMLAYIGNPGEARRRLRESERLVEDQSKKGRSGSRMVAHLIGRAHLALGHLEPARDRLRSAVETPGRVDFVPYALHALGDLALEPACFDARDAESHYRRALELAERRGMRPLAAHCHLGLGRLRARTGASDRARQHLAVAASLYREMDLRLWLAQADTEISAIEAAG